MGVLLGRANRRFVYTASALLCIILYLTWHTPHGAGVTRRDVALQSPLAPETSHCRDLPGANDTLVIMKTGSTEIRDKLPIHLATTLKCYPNYMIFSDIEETFLDEPILDALEDVSARYKDSHDDFELYRRLQRGGRKALKPSELSGPVSRSQGGGGKPTNPGWRLDKWKFLPMARRTLQEYPDQKWYLFIETDTYIFWKTLLAYLAALDWTKPYYMGAQINIGDITFAHGGTGILVSRPALQMVVRHYIDHKDEWEDFTAGHWAGDCVLGKAFKDAGAPITYAWPIFQSDDIGDMNYGRTDNQHRLWCHPTVAYHHLAPPVVQDLWEFEQAWMQGSASAVLRHKDIFAQYILPRVAEPRENWDNHCDKDEGPVSCLDECEALCEKDKSCLQFALDPDGRCYTTARPNLGEAHRGWDAGWMYNRMQAFYEDASPCGDEGWLT
ncbi:glycosyltransferase family 31 protein [Teratosphaeria destructans]|uniref:Glycosyltransferase family 31 protein n=1 Tax=Teratosphaeria destructans TaxID=418781 RepID=A0A9W7SWX2_9PEZI|nr:glycosyltransferase family 31 protein [Teratosphaeria destructans]